MSESSTEEGDAYAFYAGGLDFWTNVTNHIADTGLMLLTIDDLVKFGTAVP